MIEAMLATSIFLFADGEPVKWFPDQKEDFKFQRIEKVNGEKEWPFAAPTGKLMCVHAMGHDYVYFIPDDGQSRKRAFLLEVNLMQMAITNIGITGVLAPYSTPQQLIERIAPFLVQGRMLCKYNDGQVVPGSEL